MWVLVAETWVFIKSLRRRKDLLFWLIVFPVVYMLIVNTLFGPREVIAHFEIAVIDKDGGSLSRALVKALNETRTLKPVLVEGNPEELLKRGGYPVVLVIPPGFEANLTNARRAYLQAYYLTGSMESETALRILEGFIGVYANIVSLTAANITISYIPEPFKGVLSSYILFIASPLTLKGNPVTISTSFEAVKAFKVSLVTLTIGLMFLYVGIHGGLQSVVEKRYEGYVQAVLSSHVKPSIFMLSEITAIVTGAMITVTAIALTGLLLGAPLHEIPAYKLLVSLAILVVSILGLTGLGMTLGLVARTPQAASALGNAIAFPMMFLGGFTIPKFMLPEWLQVVPEVFPHSRLIYAITYYILGSWSLEELLAYSTPAIALSLTLLLVGALAYRRVLERIYESP
mgnify:CR=1 FL=1